MGCLRARGGDPEYGAGSSVYHWQNGDCRRMATTKKKHCQSRFSGRSVSWTRRPSLQAPLMARHLWLRGDRRGGVVPPQRQTRVFHSAFAGLSPAQPPWVHWRAIAAARALHAGGVPCVARSPPWSPRLEILARPAAWIFSAPCRDGQGPVPRQMPSGLARAIVSTRPSERIVSGVLLEYPPVSLAARSRPSARRRSRPGAICGVASCVFRCAIARA